MNGNNPQGQGPTGTPPPGAPPTRQPAAPSSAPTQAQAPQPATKLPPAAGLSPAVRQQIETSVRTHLSHHMHAEGTAPGMAGAGVVDLLQYGPLVVQIVEHVIADLQAAGLFNQATP